MKELDAYKEKLARVMETPKEELQKAFKKALEKTLEKRDDSAFGDLVRISYPCVIASDHDIRAILVLYEAKEALSPIEMCMHSKKYHEKYLRKYPWLSEIPFGKKPLDPYALLGAFLRARDAIEILQGTMGKIAYHATVREAPAYRLKRKDIIYKRLGTNENTLIEYSVSKIETFLFYTYYSLDKRLAEKRAKEMDGLMKKETEKRLGLLKKAIEQAEMEALVHPFRRAAISHAEENAALCVYGSVARESALSKSDIDLVAIYEGQKTPAPIIVDCVEWIRKKLEIQSSIAYIDASPADAYADIKAVEKVLHAKPVAWNEKIFAETKEKMLKSKACERLQEMEKHAKEMWEERAEGKAVPEIEVKYNELAEALRRRKMLSEFPISR